MSDGKKINEILNVSMDKIREMADVNTVIGDPITTPDGTTILPISRVSYGFAAGGSDLPSKSQPASGLFGGGSGAGITIVPVALLAISRGNVRVIQIEPYFSPVDRALEKVPEVADKIASLFRKDQPEETPAPVEPAEPGAAPAGEASDKPKA